MGVSGSDTAMDGTSASSQNDVLRWIEKFDVKYPVAYDAQDAVANLYLQGGFPTIAVINKAKTIVYLNSGEISYDEANQRNRKRPADNTGLCIASKPSPLVGACRPTSRPPNPSRSAGTCMTAAAPPVVPTSSMIS